MGTEIADIVKIYKDIACIPTVNSAALQVFPDKNTIKILCTWSISDLIKAESTKFTQEFLLQNKSQSLTLLSKGVPCDVSSVSQCAFTKSRNRFAVFRKAKKNEESVFLEIWSLSQKEKTFDMSERKEHGKIYDNGLLTAFEWSANEKYLLYIAEAKQKKSESYFKDTFCDKTDEKSSEETTKGEENLYRETWGERHATAHHPVLCIFEIETGKIQVLDYPETSVTQATWGPNDEDIVFIGFKETPIRLGLIFCSNRWSSVFSYNLQSKEVVSLTSDENIHVEYPVFSPNFECFVFLQNESGGPHHSCKKLMKCDWKTKKISTIIDIIDHAKGEDFAGIYAGSLSSKWWTSDSRFFFFHTFRKSFLEIFYVDILSSEVKKIDIDKSFGSCVLHDVKDPYILISVASPNLKPHLMIGYFTISDDGIQVTWNPVDDGLDSCLQDLSWNVHSLKPSLVNNCYPDLDYDIITVESTEKKNGTLIIFPHGGPHSSFWPTLYDHVAAFARLGYIICLVNYRGSLGFGENSIRSLLGNIGSQDVSDVIQAIEYLKEDKSLGIKQVVGYGGSHGGFLIAHLLGQYPDLLKAAAIRNPVIDLTSMADTSDIPDWCWIESGCSKTYDFLDTKNSSLLDEMWKKSPMLHVKNVKAPTLLCLGKNDLRVPPSQGLKFHSYLKAQNVPTKVYFYDDSHGLSKVPVTSDNFMQVALWFQSHLLQE